MQIRRTLNKLKSSLGMPIEELPEVPEPTPEKVSIENLDEKLELIDMNEIEATDKEIQDMAAAVDEGYIQYSAEVVGFENREMQWTSYETALSYVDSNSILDFGCGRGDLYGYMLNERSIEEIDYLGVDLNAVMINTGKDIYPNINLIQSDWFSLDDAIKKDWCISVGSNNLRYDADTVKGDVQYTKDSIDAMYKHCTTGVVAILTTSIEDSAPDDGLINHDPGELLNWARKEYGNVAIDHAIGSDVFVLIIYK